MRHFNISALPDQSPPDLPRFVPKTRRSQRIDDDGQSRNCPRPRRGQQLSLRLPCFFPHRLLSLSLLCRVRARRRVTLRQTHRPQRHRASLYTSLHFINSLHHCFLFQERRENLRKHRLDCDNIRVVGRPSPRAQFGGRGEDCRARKRDVGPAARRSTGTYTESGFYAFLVLIEKNSTDARRFLDVSSARFRTTAQGHCPSWFLIHVHLPPLLSRTPTINDIPLALVQYASPSSNTAVVARSIRPSVRLAMNTILGFIDISMTHYTYKSAHPRYVLLNVSD